MQYASGEGDGPLVRRKALRFVTGHTRYAMTDEEKR